MGFCLEHTHTHTLFCFLPVVVPAEVRSGVSTSPGGVLDHWTIFSAEGSWQAERDGGRDWRKVKTSGTGPDLNSCSRTLCRVRLTLNFTHRMNTWTCPQRLDHKVLTQSVWQALSSAAQLLPLKTPQSQIQNFILKTQCEAEQPRAVLVCSSVEIFQVLTLLYRMQEVVSSIPAWATGASLLKVELLLNTLCCIV